MNVHDIQFREDMPYCFHQEAKGDSVFISLKTPIKDGPLLLKRIAQAISARPGAESLEAAKNLLNIAIELECEINA